MLGKWGVEGGMFWSPSQAGPPTPQLIPTRVSAVAWAVELGVGTGEGGGLPAPPPLLSGLPGDALGGAFPAKRIGFREVCEKAPAEPIPAAISDNKALY